MTTNLTPEQIHARLALNAEAALDAKAGLKEVALWLSLVAPFVGTSIGLDQLEQSVDEAYKAQEQELQMSNKQHHAERFDRFIKLLGWMQGAEEMYQEVLRDNGQDAANELVNQVMTGPDAEKVMEFYRLQDEFFPKEKKMEHDSSSSTNQPLKDSLDYAGVEDASKYPHAAAQLSALIAKRSASKWVKAEWAAARTAASSWEGETDLEIGDDFYTVDYTVEYEASAAEADSWGYDGGTPGHAAGVEFWESRVLRATKAVAGADGEFVHEDVVDGDDLAVLTGALEEKFENDDAFREDVERQVLESLGPDDDYPDREDR